MRKKSIIQTLFATVLLASCGSDDFTIVTGSGNTQSSSGSISGGTMSTTEIGTADITTYDIQLNTAAVSSDIEDANEYSASYKAASEDFVENLLAEETEGIKKLEITYSGTTASWTYYKKNGTAVIATSATAGNSYSDDDITISLSGAHVTVNAAKKIQYVLGGSTTDGNFKLYSEKKFILDLNGVSMTNKSGAAINIQKGTDGDKRCYMRIVDGTVNTLSDGSTYTTTDGEDEKGVIFSEGKLLISGTGTLNITAQGKHGLVSDDYIYLHAGTNTNISPASGYNGIKANKAIYIAGGAHNIVCSGNAPKGLTCDSLISITGGRTTVINSGVAVYDSSEADYSQPSGLKCDSAIVISGGELYCKSTGNGGKGIRAAKTYTQNGGTVRIITSGSTVGSSGSGNMRQGMNSASSSSDAEPKGLHVGKKSDTSGVITINGGKLIVRCTGGEGAEGIESKNSITINGGMVESYCYDDAVNAAKTLLINGGYVYGYATNNDGIDSNGTITINGGVVFGSGSSTPEDGIDCDQNTFTINGGIVVGIGGSTSTPTSSTSKQASVVTSASLTANSVLALTNGSGECIVALKIPARYNGTYTMLLSAPGLSTGNTYTFKSGATISGTTFQGVSCDNTTISGGSTAWSYTQSSLVTGGSASGMGGGMPGGGFPF